MDKEKLLDLLNEEGWYVLGTTIYDRTGEVVGELNKEFDEFEKKYNLLNK